MSKIEEVPTEVKNLENKTVLSIERVVFEWTVSNFSVYHQYSVQSIRSPQFMIDNIPYRLSLQIPKNTESAGPVVIKLCRAIRDDTEQYVKYKISILDEKGNTHVTQEDKISFAGDQSAGRSMAFCFLENYDYLRSLPNDSLRIRCEVAFMLQSHHSNGEHYASVSKTCARNNVEKTRQRRKHRSPRLPVLTMLLFVFLLYSLALHLLFDLNGYHCKMWNRNVDKLVIGSTRQMINIAEALNLTEVKDKAFEFLYSFAEQHNISINELSTLDNSNSLPVS